MKLMLRSLKLVALMLSAQLVMGQGTTKEGYSLMWDRTLAVVPDSMSNGKHKLPAWTVSVFEGDASEILDMWKADMKALSTAVTGSKPAKATDARLGIGEHAVLTLATAATEKKAKLVRLTIAFAMNDSTPLASPAGQEEYMRGLAIKYNKAVVQRQIDVKEAALAKVGGKLADAQADEVKLKQKADKAKSALAKVKAKRAKVEANNAEIQGTIVGLEKKFALTNDPKDLQRLTKTRQKLADGEKGIAKLMQSEAKAQANINKYESQLPETTADQQGQTVSKEQLQSEIQALKRKQDSIR